MSDDRVLVSAFDAEQPNVDDLAGLLGGKGAGLAAMTAAGLPVPPGFTLTTDAFRLFRRDGWNATLDEALDIGIAGLEAATERRMGGDPPLLVSVRSGAPVSMPGMMDTVLDVGMGDAAERALANATGDPRFGADTHVRALLSYAEVVLHATADVLGRARATDPSSTRRILNEAGLVIPADPSDQIRRAVRAVFESWDLPRARRYREVEGIDHELGTAATVQLMVFGNLGTDSGTGVAFTRDPATGAPGLMGDFLVGAQGEDVVSGDHVTLPLSEMADRWSDQWAELDRIATVLEHRYADMVDIEFTVERGRLWLLQSRRAKRSPIAVFRSAIDMADDPGFPVDRAEAVCRCEALLDDPPTVIDADEGEQPEVARGVAASPGRATGVLCVDPDEAVRLEADGLDVVLARRETSPADVHGMAAARGLFTTLGGMVSHAAVVARSWGLPAVVGASDATVDEAGVHGPHVSVAVGEVVTVDGDRGRLFAGGSVAAGTVAPEALVIRRWMEELAADVTADPDDGTGSATQASGDSPASFELLHALRIKGMATAEALAGMLGVDESVARSDLEALVAAGSAQLFEARGLWRLTTEGMERHDAALERELASIDLTRLPYAAFLELNEDFKQMCTDWQLCGGEPNDHTDVDHDRAVLERLRIIDEQVQVLLVDIAQVVWWTGGFASRLAAAREAAMQGDHRRVTGVMCDSYHDVWMELHEDLILTQGIDRAAEGST